MDYKYMVERSMADSKTIFNKYDTGEKGFIVFHDLCALFEDLGLKEKFKYTFDEFMQE